MKNTLPWYRKDRNAWYCEPHGKRILLGKHPDGAAKPVKSKKSGLWNVPQEILDAYHKLMSTKKPVVLNDEAVANILDDFLTWCLSNRAARTEERYRDFIQDFINFEGIGRLGVTELTSTQVTQWLDAHQKWNNTTKANAITALQRGFNWACKNRGLNKRGGNPIKGMEKPQAEARTETLTPAEFEILLKHATPNFCDLITVSWDCGARPQEIKRLEARHIELDRQRAVLPRKEAKGKRRARAIYIPTERSLQIIARLCKEHPEGPLFLNARGNPWTGYAVKCSFARMDEKVGRRIHQYMFRRTWITRKLVAGVDSHVVAQLSGHSDTSMIDKHYSAIADDPAFMLAQAAKDIVVEKPST